MTLIKVKNKFVAPLPQLAKLALRYVYDREHMKSGDIELMLKSVVAWKNKIDITEEELYDLQTIGKFLKNDEDGKFESRKETFKRHKINWAKFHRVPELRRFGEC